MKDIKINIFNIHQYIFLFLIIKIQSIPFFKTIPAINNKYYIITPDKIIFLNNNKGNYDTKLNLTNNQIISNEDEYEKVSYGKLIKHLQTIHTYL